MNEKYKLHTCELIHIGDDRVEAGDEGHVLVDAALPRRVLLALVSTSLPGTSLAPQADPEL
jgi:hypothetical protein